LSFLEGFFVDPDYATQIEFTVWSAVAQHRFGLLSSHSRIWSFVVAADFLEQYREGLRLFNEEDFFECHEVFEELWSESQGDDKKYLQGMIQAAVALFHFGNENFGGAKKLYNSAHQKLTPLGSPYMGIDLTRFLGDFEACFHELITNTEAYPTTVALQDELVPRIHAVEEGLIE
jgi:predicted metal-dependent hydrolase